MAIRSGQPNFELRSGPLRHLRVLEIGALVATSLASQLFAEFGADVVTVERRNEMFRLEASLRKRNKSRGRKSLTIDFKKPLGVELLRKLVARSDAVIENLQPGVMESLGLGWDELSAINPYLVLVPVGRFGWWDHIRHNSGVVGTCRGLPTSDRAEGHLPPRDEVSGASVADLNIVIGALVGLLHARESGYGQIVDAPLIERAVASDHFEVTERTDRIEAARSSSSPIYNTCEIADYSRLKALGKLQERDLMSAGSMFVHSATPRACDAPNTVRWIEPPLDVDVKQILAEIGYDDAKIAELRKARVI